MTKSTKSPSPTRKASLPTASAGKPKPTAELAKAIAKFLYDGKDVKAFAAAGRSFKNLEVTEEQLSACKAPFLFIHGGNESDYVKDRVAAVRKLLHTL